MENNMYDMKITNDCKGKSQSFECLIVLKNEEETVFYGYGSDELEAKEDCLEKIEKYSNCVNYTLDSLKLDIRLEKSGAKAYLNKVNVLFNDSMARYEVLKDILKRNNYKCTHEFSPMVGPATRFERGLVAIVFSCVDRYDDLTVFYSQMPVLSINNLDFDNFEYFEQLVKGLFPELNPKDCKED